jgi:DNA modification methylase
MFAMGEHRIICGDSTDSRSLEILMSDDEARLILTDEPYNVPVADMDRIAAGGAPGHVTCRRRPVGQ